jgi:GT2 family glycosyltransferase
MKTYIVIPQYIITEEIKQLAINTIKSFRDNAEVTIISVDDASPMNCDFLKELSDVYIKNDKNGGFSITCNTGFKWIFENEKDDCYIICANNDIRVNKRAIIALQEPFEKYDNVSITGIVSTKVDYYEGIPIEEFNWNSISEGGQLRDRIQDGGLWMSKKSILEKIGIFDEEFKQGYEDIDLFLRARDTFGMRIVMSGMGAYWHKQGATRFNLGFDGRYSDAHENHNLDYFCEKWKFNPHIRQIWQEKILFNI